MVALSDGTMSLQEINDLQTKMEEEDLLGGAEEDDPIIVPCYVVPFLLRVRPPPLDAQDRHSPCRRRLVVMAVEAVRGDVLLRPLPCPLVRLRRIRDTPGFQC